MGQLEVLQTQVTDLEARVKGLEAYKATIERELSKIRLDLNREVATLTKYHLRLSTVTEQVSEKLDHHCRVGDYCPHTEF